MFAQFRGLSHSCAPLSAPFSSPLPFSVPVIRLKGAVYLYPLHKENYNLAGRSLIQLVFVWGALWTTTPAALDGYDIRHHHSQTDPAVGTSPQEHCILPQSTIAQRLSLVLQLFKRAVDGSLKSWDPEVDISVLSNTSGEQECVSAKNVWISIKGS